MGGGYRPLCGTLGVFAVILLAYFAVAPSANAAFGSGNIMCMTPPFIGPCKYPMPCPKAPIFGVIGKPCQEEANGKVCTGACSAPGKCEAKGCSGIGGGSEVAGIGKALEAAMGMLKDLLKPKGGGGGGGGGAPPGGASPMGPLYPTCVRNPATNTVSPIPCTEANGQINYGGTSDNGSSLTLPAGEGGTGNSTGQALLDILNGVGNEPDSNTNTNSDTNSVSVGATTNSSASTSDASGTPSVNVVVGGGGSLSATSSQQKSLQGDIVVGGSGGVLYVRSRDVESNTEVAGFYGGSVPGNAQPSSLIGRMCRTRPWGDGVLGGLISGAFFDGLCKRFGYGVGELATTPSGGRGLPAKSSKIIITQNPATRPSQAPAQAVNPEVDIWANPSSVRLGTRTYIYWNSRDVVSCVEKGPSFEHNTLTGGASTVPLSDTTIFTIECLAADGRTVKDSVRVTISL